MREFSTSFGLDVNLPLQEQKKRENGRKGGGGDVLVGLMDTIWKYDFCGKDFGKLFQIGHGKALNIVGAVNTPIHIIPLGALEV